MTGIINYGAGNIHSIINAVKRCGSTPLLLKKGADFSMANNLILPGVGAFGDGMNFLLNSGMVQPIKEAVKSGKPFLGICLGMQLLLSHSEEGDCDGLGLIKGLVKKFRFENRDMRIPHMGWNKMQIISRNEKLFNGIPSGEYFYFAHSYYTDPIDNSVAAGKTFYGQEFVSAIQKNNILGVQFHPEKSGDYGLLFLKNFLEGKWLQ